MSGSRAVRKLAVAVSLLPLLAACGADGETASAGKQSAGSAGQLDVPADAGAELKNQYLVENAIADCMKEQGFTYTAVAPVDPASSWATDGADYELTKKFRQKYGFGYTARAVYPDDPELVGDRSANEPSANAKYVETLTPAQKTAYDKALGSVPGSEKGQNDWTGCLATANKKVYGSTSPKELLDASSRSQENAQALNGDQKLVGLAQSYASCLKRDGIPVTTTQPTSIGEMVKLQASASAPAGGGGPAAAAENPDGTSTESMSKEEALPLLTKEIALAMKDLECGKDFRAAYFPQFFKNPGSTGAG
ncbi:hypothetical protein [Streptomyces sp. NPDC000618]|uniref:hypothetical protein n=1 Tax=Streptomyces sp. NPDC000618 TaxID=3154265 RepID=UPI00333354A1